jgi:acetyltransferase
VLKLHSETITHKTDVGGVQLDLGDAAAVRGAFKAISESVTAKAGAEHFLGVTVQPMEKVEGYELILGSSIDPQFGPVVLFGLGGQLVEVFKDRALGIPPLTTTLARRMMERTRIHTALKGVRGRPPVDLAGLEWLIVRFGQLVTEQRWIREMDINPLVASPEKLLSLDARVVLYDREVQESSLPKLAIRPYPIQYVDTWTAKNGTEITFRPILPEDEMLLAEFHKLLSELSVYMRYLHPMMLQDRIVHERLARICHCDYDRDLPLVAVKENADGTGSILGVGRLTKLRGSNGARLSVLVVDRYQGLGIGSELVRRVVDVAKREGIERLEAILTSDNRPMQHIFRELGFKIEPASDPKLQTASLEL